MSVSPLIRQAATSEPSANPTPAGRPHQNLRPRNGQLIVVRFANPTRARGDAEHRYFRRGHDARRFARRLAAQGFPIAVFAARVEWTETGA